METTKSSDRYVTLVAAGAAVGGFLFGFDTSTMNSAINGIAPDLGLGTGRVGFVAAIVLIGCAVGAAFAGRVSARIGRTWVMTGAGILLAVGSVASALSDHEALLGLFRFVSGLGIGAASAVVPAYVSEVAPTRIRGRLGTFWQFAIVIGQLLGLLAGYGLTQWAGSEMAAMPWGGAAWRWMFGLVALVALVYCGITRLLPQSPHDLMRHGHEDEARSLVARLEPGAAGETIAAIRNAQAGQRQAGGLKDLRGSRFGLQAIVWVGMLLAAFQQLVGINVVKTYSNSLWRLVGFSTDASFAISIVTILISIASTVVAIAIMDKVGRRTLLIAGAGFMAPALGTLAICFSTATGSGDDVRIGRTAGIIALVAMNVFAIAFGVTWGPVMWLMLSELFDSDLRTIAVAVCTAVNWMTNWAVTRSFPTLADSGLGFAYGLYTAFAVLALIFAWKVLPETRGRERA